MVYGLRCKVYGVDCLFAANIAVCTRVKTLWLESYTVYPTPCTLYRAGRQPFSNKNRRILTFNRMPMQTIIVTMDDPP